TCLRPVTRRWEPQLGQRMALDPSEKSRGPPQGGHSVETTSWLMPAGPASAAGHRLTARRAEAGAARQLRLAARAARGGGELAAAARAEAAVGGDGPLAARARDDRARGRGGGLGAEALGEHA